MGVVIGSLTQVVIDGENSGFQSVNWSVQVQPNRLWELGSWDPYATQVSETINISVTTYAEVLNQLALSPSTACEDSTARKDILIQADACGPSAAITVDESGMFLTSYSYTKSDPTAFGTETWSFTKWIGTTGLGADYIDYPAPTYVLQGRAEGNRSGDVGNGTSDLGIVLLPDGQVTGQQGSVTAGFPGLGQADDIIYGLVSYVGGGLLEAAGEYGQSSATVPHQPLYLGT